MHDHLLELLREALACHGYTTTRQAALEGRSGTVYTVPLLAEGERGAIVIDVQDDDPLPAAAIADMADVLHDVGADVALLCHLGEVEPGPHAAGVTLWGLDHLRHLVGDALVGKAAQRRLEPLAFGPMPAPITEPLAESLTQILPAAFQDEPPAATFDLDALEQMDLLDPGGAPMDDAIVGGAAAPATSPDVRNASSGSPRPESAPQAYSVYPVTPTAAPAHPTTPAPDPVDPAPRYAHPLLPVRVTPEEARVRVRKLLTAEHVQMVLQPVHLIDYECDLLAEGSLRYDTVNGRVQVHGTDKTVSEVDAMAVDPQGFTRLPDMPRLPSHERTLRVSDERAGERAAAHLMGSHTRIVEIEVDDPDRGYAYTEKKKVEPRPDHIRLNSLGTFHRVLWRLVGPAGHVDVDALTGDVVEEVLQSPRHDTMVID